ncbi:MAG: ClbS/DfsB family four-helix bundle protein [Chloroflexota bacterium]|nr:ClbS/DfsB family four-helix bundle protein [Chloroflexota bacterium]
MTNDSLKSEALRRIDDEHARWQELVAEVGDDRMDEPGPMDAWTFKDLVSHLTGWRSYSVSRLEAVVRGEADAPFPWPTVLTTDDQINDWLRQTDQDRTTAEVLADHEATWIRLRSAIEAMPDEMLADPGSFPWLEGDTVGDAIVDGRYFAHLHEEHEPGVREWLEQTAGRSA